MPVDPASIPDHVVAAAIRATDDIESHKVFIAAAFDALMDDRLVRVPLGAYHEHVRPSDVLAAVLAQEATDA